MIETGNDASQVSLSFINKMPQNDTVTHYFQTTEIDKSITMILFCNEI